MIAASPTWAAWPLFAMDNGVGRGSWSAAQQASVLKELGYAGISYNYTNPADLTVWRRELAARDLALVGLYVSVRLEPEPVLPPGLPEAIEGLRGSGAVVWLVLPVPAAPGDYEERALTALRKVADLAAPVGVRVVLYPHTRSYPATADQALPLVLRSGRANVGLTVNLAHELAAGNGAALPSILRRVAPVLDLVTLNGATDRPAGGWEQLIQVLGRGDYEVGALLRVLREIHYAGPVGLQFYNVKGEPRENLAAARTAWQALQTTPSVP
jgi:sugar phosphate isomerase/epimerase